MASGSTTDFGDYRLGRRIAVGGMAEVFHAERRDGQRVALKLLLPQYARDPELVQMLAEEARLQSSITHANLVRVVEFGRVGKQPFIALELVDGASLRAVLDAGALAPSLAAHIAREVCRALVAVHAADVVHRDVTPENILVARTGEVRLGDFGIARSALTAGRTRTGVIKGKLAYLAPEQLRGASADARTDVYALGLVLFEAVAGAPYLTGDSEHEVLRAAESPTFRSSGDARIDEVARAMLASSPEDRPTAAELVDRLTALAPDPAGLVARVERAASTDDEDAPRPGTVRVVRAPRRRWPIAAAGIALAGVASAGAWLALRDRGAPAVAIDRDAASDVRPADAPSLAVAPDAAEPVRTPPTDAGKPVRVPPADDVPLDAPARDAGPPDARAIVAEGPRDAAPPPADAPVDAGSDLADLSRRRSQLRADLGARGILEADLPPDARAALARADTATPDAADAAIADAARALAAVRIDEAFVRAKLDRMNAAIRRADRTRVNAAELDRLAALALEDLLDRRLEACNRRLNELARMLTR